MFARICKNAEFRATHTCAHKDTREEFAYNVVYALNAILIYPPSKMRFDGQCLICINVVCDITLV